MLLHITSRYKIFHLNKIVENVDKRYKSGKKDLHICSYLNSVHYTKILLKSLILHEHNS